MWRCRCCMHMEEYAYAITCHKAQGGQWNDVFVDLAYIPEDALGLPVASGKIVVACDYQHVVARYLFFPPQHRGAYRAVVFRGSAVGAGNHYGVGK